MKPSFLSSDGVKRGGKDQFMLIAHHLTVATTTPHSMNGRPISIHRITSPSGPRF